MYPLYSFTRLFFNSPSSFPSIFLYPTSFYICHFLTAIFCIRHPSLSIVFLYPTSFFTRHFSLSTIFLFLLSFNCHLSLTAIFLYPPFFINQLSLSANFFIRPILYILYPPYILYHHMYLSSIIFYSTRSIYRIIYVMLHL